MERELTGPAEKQVRKVNRNNKESVYPPCCRNGVKMKARLDGEKIISSVVMVVNGRK
jgi:hypothetical protein